MNDARWLRYWIAEHAKAPLVDEAEAEALAMQAQRDADRDGFSLDAALREADCDTIRSFILKTLKDRAESA